MTAREVTIDGGSPWGFRMHGGADLQQPLRISRVNPGSKAAYKGIREGDVISSINGQSTKDKTNAEAHSLLKNAGDVLKLGLNEEGGSPKKRQFKTVQQESHSETIKRSTTTTQVLTTTKKETHVDSTKGGAAKTNGERSINLNGGSQHYEGQDCFSEKSTISSNYSSTVSTPSTLTDTQGGEKSQLTRTSENQTKEAVEEMPDTVSTKSRKRRRNNGNQRKASKPNKQQPESIKDIPKETKNVSQIYCEVKSEESYRVESPKTVSNGKKKGCVIKSKSLDDDEALKIQEISSETITDTSKVDQTDNIPLVVIEAESDDSSEVTDSNKKNDENEIRTMDVETLHLETNPDQSKIISIQDESNLRCFLESLNLPTTPEEASAQNKESSEIIRAKRAKKREELAQYFFPVYQNPRYLDVISEENSDHSDKEGKDHKVESRKPKIQRYIPKLPVYNHQKVETVLIEMENVETPIISDTCTISLTEQSSGGVEVVFLDDNDESEDEDQNDSIPSSQLTPPPTPDSLSPKSTYQNEVFTFENELEETPTQPIQRSCALSPTLPSRSPSYDREDSSSRGTSLCTTICLNLEPKCLRELCLDKLVSLPFGQDVLEELASVSKSLQELTNNLTSPQTNISDFGIPEKEGAMKPEDKWVGIATEDDPKVVVCLSPTQKEYLESTKVVPREADKLLELHQKFIERSYYSDTEVMERNSNGDSRLLPLINEIKPKREIKDPKNLENPRLQAKNLSEWLQLARTSISASDYNVNPEYYQKRRKSLPNELYVQQMQTIIQKEKEIQQELEKLEEEKRKLQNDITTTTVQFDPSKYHISKNEDIAIHTEELKRPKIKPTQPPTEKFRNQMYKEYMQQIAEREERKHHKVIKISSHQDLQPMKTSIEKELVHAQGIEDEFMTKLKEKKYNQRTSVENENNNCGSDEKSEDDPETMVVIDDGKGLSGTKKLPKHLREFVDITRQASENLHLQDNEGDGGIWSPGQRESLSSDDLHRQPSLDQEKNDEPIAAIWTPKSAGSSPQFERKEFRPVNFNSPVLSRKNKSNPPVQSSQQQVEPPWTNSGGDVGASLTSALQKRIPNSHSAPPSGFSELSQAPRLPRAQNPTITLLQKAREGQLPKGASYIDDPPLPPRKRESPPKITPGEIVYEIKNEYTSESEGEKPKRIAELGPRKFIGIGPTTTDGMPLTLRSEVRDQNHSKWYKKMYDTIHKQKPRYDDDYVTVRYKHRRGRYPYTSGYVSEPEPGTYDSDTGFFYPGAATLDRRRTHDSAGDTFTATYTMPRSIPHSNILKSDVIKHGKDVYRNQPGRIENYIPGHSSISEKEAKEWWDEVMDIFDGHLEQQKHIPSKGYMSQALKESGYESDSTLVFRRRDDTASQLSPSQQKEAYKSIQRGGDVPLHGLRKPAPERPKEHPAEIEYIPISSTLMKIRVHKNSPTRYRQEELMVYPVNTFSSENLFKNYKRSAPSSISKLPPVPPSPPKRKSSRNNSTLRLISTMRVKSDKAKDIGKRHETCFLSGPSVTKTSNVKYLRDKITCKLSPAPKRKGETKIKVTKTITASPELKSKISSTLSTAKDARSSTNRVYSRTNISDLSTTSLSRTNSANSLRRTCRSCSSSPARRSTSKSDRQPSLTKSRTSSLDRTFGVEKSISRSSSEKRLLKSPELLSPTEVKKAGSVIKKQTKPLLSSVRNGQKSLSKHHDLPIQVTISDKGRQLLRSTSSPTSTKNTKLRKSCLSPALSTSSDKSRISKSSVSMESLKSLKALTKKEPPGKKETSSKKESSKSSLKKSSSAAKLPREVHSPLRKSKKDQLNGEIAKKEKSPVTRDSIKPCEDRRVPITLADIKKQKETVETDSFFQHLFLRNSQPIQKSETFSNTSSWIAEKTKALERRSSIVSEPSIGALKIYLNNRKPVSDSKFKILDAAIRSRSASPKSVRFESGIPPKRNIYHERSISLPPKLTRTTIVRPRSPTRLVFPEERPRRSPERIIFTETVRPLTPPLEKGKHLSFQKAPIRSRSSSPKTPETLYFSQTRRPISPYSSNQSISTQDYHSEMQSYRSPSYRKIQKTQVHGDTLEYIKRKIPRSRSAGATDDYRKPFLSQLYASNLTQSSSSIDSFCSKREYQDYVRDLLQSKRKSERFKELNKFYSTIERLGQLEKTTSSSDLRPRRKYEDEIIDYDRWKEVRSRERAEKEMTDIYKELDDVQREKDLLFLPKHIQKWKRNCESGLRIREKSVEDIKEDFEKLNLDESEIDKNKLLELQLNRDTYKPLWRGSSVINLAQTMTQKRSQPDDRLKALEQQKKIDSERLLTRGIGSRIWSSLSMEQVNALKNQLAEIYQNGYHNHKNDEKKVKNGTEDYFVDVPQVYNKKDVTSLTVRRNSDSSKMAKKDFNGDIQPNQLILSETEKKKLSQSLSQEILEKQRQKYKTSVSLVLAKETRGAVAAAEANVKMPSSSELPSPRTCYSLEMSEDGDFKKQRDGEFLIVLSKNDKESAVENKKIAETLTDWAQPKKALIKTDAIDTPKKTSSNSETESTDESTRTILHVDTKEVKKKVDYFEHVHEKDEYMPTIYKPADDVEVVKEQNSINTKKEEIVQKSLSSSRSCQDFKEFFGENDSAKATSPISRATSRCSKVSERSRSVSPNPEIYYLSLAKCGDVQKLKNKFDSIRRCNSDSEILRRQVYIPGIKNGEVDNLRRRYEYPHLAGRGRSRIRRGGMVSPLFLKAEDRYMPHINIISKIASLYPKRNSTRERQKSIEELADILGISVGEVEKMRRRFDSPDRMSLLGHMFTSSPNLNELRDIAPYLTASWTAHKFPKKEDNTRLLSASPDDASMMSSMDTSLVRKTKLKKPKSSTQSKVKLSSILKLQETEGTSTRKSPSPIDAQPSPTATSSRYSNKSWWPASQIKPSVTFSEEPDAPVPPPKGLRRKGEYQESPRKYVENEVTIHYKTPVRQEVKEVVSEDELQRRQAEHMKKVYQEERRRKYLQVSQSLNGLDELQDMNSRRHTDNFIPSQKSPIPLNRYDDVIDDYSPKLKPRPRSPEPRLVAKALYNFVGQTARELTFRKGDIIYIRRQVDKNWYEGEHNAMVGLFPANYVEIVPYDGVKSTSRKSHEGQARAKYNFIAQTHLELSLAKGELVVITRRVDDNWFEGKIGGRKGIFPVSYVEVLIDPSDPPPVPQPSKPAASPAAHSILLNGSLGGKESMGTHNYVPHTQTNTSHSQNISSEQSYHAKPIQLRGAGTYGSLSRKNPLNQELHVDTQSEPYIPYRALYKYKPQNEDEIELNEGDTVYVLEKCDDGWFVGASDRTGALGTFPGNYVERI